jgi:Flp pilus assembly protein TadD
LRIASPVLLAGGLLWLCIGPAATAYAEEPPVTLADRLARQDAQVAAGNFEAAEIEAKEWISKAKDSAEARFLLGRLYGNANRLDEARVQFSGALELDITYALAWRGLAKVHLRMKEYEAAVREAQKALTLEPGLREGIELLATCLYNAGDRPGAFRTVEEALREKPEQTELRFFLASLHFGDGNARSAEAELKQVIAGAPAHNGARRMHIILLMQLDRPAEAEEACVKAMEVLPDDPEFLVLLRDIRMRAGNLEGAIKAVEALVKLELPAELLARAKEDLASLIDAREKAGAGPQKPTVESLSKAMESPDVLVRRAAIVALADMDLEGVPPAAARAVTDKDEQIRVVAVQMLTRAGGVAATGLFEVLLFHPRDRDPSETVRVFAARGLGSLGAPAALPVLMRAVEEEDPELLGVAIWGIYRITGVKFVDEVLDPVPAESRKSVREAYRSWWATNMAGLYWRRKAARDAGASGSRALFRYVLPWIEHEEASMRVAVRDGLFALTEDPSWKTVPLDTPEDRKSAMERARNWIERGGAPK